MKPPDFFDPENEREARLEAAYAQRDRAWVSYDDEANRDVGALLAEWRRLTEAGVEAEIDWVNGLVLICPCERNATSGAKS